MKNAQKKDKKVVYHTHTTYEDFKGSIKFSNQLAVLIKCIAKKAFNKADFLISPSEYTKNLIDTKYTHGTKEIRVISNGVSTKKFTKKEELAKKFLEEYKITKPIIITAGLPFERKGIKEFVKIVEMLPEYEFLWFGSSSIKKLLPKKISNIIDNPPKNLTFPGFVDGDILQGAFSAANAFLFMTYEENEGIVVLESLSAELPIVLRDIPVYENWLDDKENCFKARNNEEFVQYLKKLVNKEISNVDEIIKNGRNVAIERDLEYIGKQYKEYYEYILSK